MQEPIVSIIMGVYNEEKTIRKCLKSIIDQTYANWEAIICDDGSSDKTIEIIEEYQQKDDRIVLLKNQKNMRLAATLNRCLEAAKGKYIARMDADDVCLPRRIETQVLFLEDHPNIDCVGCNMLVFDENGDKGIRKGIEDPKKEDMLIMNPFFHPTIMMKKAVYDSLGGYTVSEKTMRAEDLDLWFRFFKDGYKGYNLQEPLYMYHESIEDYKKRTVKAAVGTAKVYLDGYRMLGFSKWKYVYAIKPIVSALIPKSFMNIYHRKKLF